MRPSLPLFNQILHLRLFTRSPCGLCEAAKSTVLKLQANRPQLTNNNNGDTTPIPIHYTETHITEPKHKSWREIYEFDVPVLHVKKKHASPSAVEPTRTENGTNNTIADGDDNGDGDITSSALSNTRRLFHRFSLQELEKVIHEVWDEDSNVKRRADE